MASPQAENGFTRIANEILEQLSHPGINGSEFRVLMFVFRKTYGFGKVQDRISLTQFQKATFMERKQAVETIKSLVDKKILIKNDTVINGSIYSFNKNWEEWLVGKRPLQRVVGKSPQGSGQKTTKSSGQKTTHKRKKETNTKENTAGTSPAGKIEVRYNPLGAEIIKAFEEVNPACKKYYANTTQRKACDNLLEEYGLEQTLKVVAFLPKSNKMSYVPTIQTPLQLWEKYQALKDGLQRKNSEQIGKKPIIV